MKGEAIVLDTSALIALIFDEPGANKVMPYLANAIMSTVNVLETATILRSRGIDLAVAEQEISRLLAEIVLLDQAVAYQAAELYPYTKAHGLSLGDRACLGLAKSRNLPVLTADKVWKKLDIGADVRLIR
jgi:ribonuclease VapC